MTRNILVILAVSVFACSRPSMAQEWGEVAEEALTMTAVPEDPEADAVILFDKGMAAITLRFELVFKHHRRIKILTKRGLKYADVSISSWHKDRIENLKAQAILPDGKKSKLRKKDIFEKRHLSRKEIVFAIPGVEVGSVIEYAYEIHSKRLDFLKPWLFQGPDFTRLSELTVVIPEGLNYHAFTGAGAVPEPVREPFQVQDPRLGGAIMGQFTWRAENMPAIRPEPYISNLRDHLAAIYFQIISFKNPRDFHAKPIVFAKKWDDLAKAVGKEYHAFLTANHGMKQLAQTLFPDTEDGRVKAEAIYTYVKNTIETAPNRALSGDLKHPREVVEDKKGSAIEKNLLLVALLRSAGLDAHPLLISTRDHGRFHEKQISLQHFNHVISHLRLGDDSYFLDTENKWCPFGMLPPNDLTDKGLLIEDEGGRIIQIPTPRGVNMRHASTRAALTEAGDLICHTVLRFEGYRGMAQRTALSREKEEDYVKKILGTRFSDVTVDSFRINHIDEIEIPLGITIDYRVHNYAQVVGEMVYLTPALIHRLQSNPFKKEERNLPVEYDYGRASNEEVHLTAPEGYRVLETPETVRIPSRGLRFTSMCTADSNKVVFQRHFMLNKVAYTPREYSWLRNAYERIAGSDQGQVVLTNRTQPDGTDE